MYCLRINPKSAIAITIEEDSLKSIFTFSRFKKCISVLSYIIGLISKSTDTEREQIQAVLESMDINEIIVTRIIHYGTNLNVPSLTMLIGGTHNSKSST